MAIPRTRPRGFDGGVSPLEDPPDRRRTLEKMEDRLEDKIGGVEGCRLGVVWGRIARESKMEKSNDDKIEN